MTIQDKIRDDLDRAVLLRNDKLRISNLRVIMGELQRQKDKILPDKKVIKILNDLKKSEEDLIKAIYDGETTKFMKLLHEYLPPEVDKETIIAWLRENVDFSQLKNRMSAIGLVKKEFPGVDGKIVKEILQNQQI